MALQGSDKSVWTTVCRKKVKKAPRNKHKNVNSKRNGEYKFEEAIRHAYLFVYRAACDGSRANSQSTLRGAENLPAEGTLFEQNFVSALQIYCQKFEHYMTGRGLASFDTLFSMSSPNIKFPSKKVSLLFRFNHSVLCMLLSKDSILGIADEALRVIIDNAVNKNSGTIKRGVLPVPTFTYVVRKFVEKFQAFEDASQFRYELFKREFGVTFNIEKGKTLRILFPSFRIWAAFVGTKHLWVNLPNAPVLSWVETYEGETKNAYLSPKSKSPGTQEEKGRKSYAQVLMNATSITDEEGGFVDKHEGGEVEKEDSFNEKSSNNLDFPLFCSEKKKMFWSDMVD